MSETAPASRLAVRKTYKLFIGGAFPRSESGRSYAVTDHKGKVLVDSQPPLLIGRRLWLVASKRV